MSTSVSRRRDGLVRRVRVRRGERAVVARVHRLEHVERLAAAALADDDAVGAHAERVLHEIADRVLAAALEVRRARLERDDVRLLELELGGVLDGDDALVRRDRAREHVEQRRLAGAGAAGDDDVLLRVHAAREEARPCAAVIEPKLDELVERERRSSRTCGS